MNAICSISGVAYQTGVIRPVADLVSDCTSQAQVASITNNGFESYSVWERTPHELMLATARQSFDRSGICPGEVVDTFYSTNSMWNTDLSDLPAVHRLLRSLSMEHSRLTGVFLSGCSNLTEALRHASNLIRIDRANFALLITADCSAPMAGSRLPVGDYAVMGDAAASCLVQAPGQGDYDVLGIGVSLDVNLCDTKLGSGSYLIGVAVGMRTAVDRALAAASLNKHDISHVFMSNLHPRFCRASLQALSLNTGILYDKTLSKYGHCFASDIFINLGHAAADGIIKTGEKILLYSQSIGSWGAILLEATTARKTVSVTDASNVAGEVQC